MDFTRFTLLHKVVVVVQVEHGRVWSGHIPFKRGTTVRSFVFCLF